MWKSASMMEGTAVRTRLTSAILALETSVSAMRMVCLIARFIMVFR